MLSKLYDKVERPPGISTGSEQLDNIRMIQLLQKVVLHHQVGEVGAAGTGFQHFDSYLGVT